jgi:hypothetical protein
MYEGVPKFTSISLFASGRLNYVAFSGLCNKYYYWDFCMIINIPPFMFDITLNQLSWVLCTYRHQLGPRRKHLAHKVHY